jgi:hypothetical protein
VRLVRSGASPVRSAFWDTTPISTTTRLNLQLDNWASSLASSDPKDRMIGGIGQSLELTPHLIPPPI